LREAHSNDGASFSCFDYSPLDNQLFRELKNILRKAGFKKNSEKGSHTKWSHPLLSGKIILSGNDGSDAKPYQEKDVEKALKRLKDIK
jgi:predicted RNA binding protein YcfA (HicA-like mRNA interferase family)